MTLVAYPFRKHKTFFLILHKKMSCNVSKFWGAQLNNANFNGATLKFNNFQCGVFDDSSFLGTHFYSGNTFGERFKNMKFDPYFESTPTYIVVKGDQKITGEQNIMSHFQKYGAKVMSQSVPAKKTSGKR